MKKQKSLDREYNKLIRKADALLREFKKLLQSTISKSRSKRRKK